MRRNRWRGAEYIRTEVMPEFFKNFWVRRMALDRRNYNQLVETTLEIALKVGASEIIGRVVEDLKDESEPYRRMVMETITKVIEKLGTADVDEAGGASHRRDPVRVPGADGGRR